MSAFWLLALPPVTLGCGELCMGTSVPTVELRAELASTPKFVGDLVSSPTPEVDAWRAAIGDATSPTGVSGVVILKTVTGDVLSLRLPFPLTAGQDFPVRGDVSSSAHTMPFTFEAAGDPPAAGAWLNRCLAPMADRACLLAQRQEIIEGTMHVESARPLRTHLSIAVSYGDAAALMPLAIDGDLSFSITDGAQCLD